MARQRLTPPLDLPEPCPICGSKVTLTDVDEWEPESGKILKANWDCETEPDIDGPDWWDWHRNHFRTPYVDWMPYETRALEWLNRRYYYTGEAKS